MLRATIHISGQNALGRPLRRASESPQVSTVAYTLRATVVGAPATLSASRQLGDASKTWVQ
eukprot:8486487-Pyramimonas_sp.AAC.1